VFASPAAVIRSNGTKPIPLRSGPDDVLRPSAISSISASQVTSASPPPIGASAEGRNASETGGRVTVFPAERSMTAIRLAGSRSTTASRSFAVSRYARKNGAVKPAATSAIVPFCRLTSRTRPPAEDCSLT